ncbi:ECF transporter S component [Mycoplasma sp. SG1]|uniref:ECF transporter S component n=1 Tax=Mycoplasma sp. SG1 TaxID=2810348 RepID=UPI002025707C|nr:ECF transporter S component [Mycoplasma sp. SG1]URM52872.1 ECF transporter S component [Mycoplasma sp. SG1]
MKNLKFNIIHHFKEVKLKNNKLTTKKIINISIFSAASVAMIVVLFSYTPILIFPTAKIAFEGVFIKIVGYLFGPFCGAIIGLITELLVNLIRPSFVHWVFFVTMIVYGLIGGIGNFINRSFSYRLKMISFFLFLGLVLGLYVGLWYYYDSHGLVTTGSFIDSIFKSALLISFLVITIILIAILAIFISCCHFLKKQKLVADLIPIIIFSGILDFGIGNFLIPIADHSILGISYGTLVFLKFFVSPIIFLFNIAIIYTVVTVLNKILKNHA